MPPAVSIHFPTHGTLSGVIISDTFDEKYLPGPVWWLSGPGFGFAIGIALWPIHAGIAVGAGAVMTLIVIALLALWAPRISVANGQLRAGAAVIDVAWLGDGEVLKGEVLRQAMGPGLDARTWTCVRPWMRKAVFIENTDPRDPAPAWIISSRRPQQLLAAIVAARGD